MFDVLTEIFEAQKAEFKNRKPGHEFTRNTVILDGEALDQDNPDDFKRFLVGVLATEEVFLIDVAGNKFEFDATPTQLGTAGHLSFGCRGRWEVWPILGQKIARYTDARNANWLGSVNIKLISEK